jgi:hypothetical protein
MGMIQRALSACIVFCSAASLGFMRGDHPHIAAAMMLGVVGIALIKAVVE